MYQEITHSSIAPLKVSTAESYAAEGYLKLTTESHGPYYVLFVDPKHKRIVQRGVAKSVSFNRGIRVTQIGDTLDQLFSRTSEHKPTSCQPAKKP